MMKVNTTPLNLLTWDKRTVTIYRWYTVGEFSIHRTIGEERGWTVTHTRSGIAVMIRIRTRRQAVEAAEELAILTNKWRLIHDRDSMKAIFNTRERCAVQTWITQVWESRRWSFQ